MCVGPFRPPSPPPLPEPKAVAPRPEQTARRVVIGQQRATGQKRRQGIGSTARGRRRLGTASLRIPLLMMGGQSGSIIGTGNLNY